MRGLMGLQNLAADAAQVPLATQITDAINAAAKGTTAVVQAIKNPGVTQPTSPTVVSSGSGSGRGNNLWYTLGIVAVVGGGAYYLMSRKKRKK